MEAMRPLVNNQQPSLLEPIEEAPRIALAPRQKAQLAPLVQVLLAEIAAALAKKEAGDEQDHH
jgi:hypothetical protein